MRHPQTLGSELTAQPHGLPGTQQGRLALGVDQKPLQLPSPRPQPTSPDSFQAMGPRLREVLEGCPGSRGVRHPARWAHSKRPRAALPPSLWPRPLSVTDSALGPQHPLKWEFRSGVPQSGVGPAMSSGTRPEQVLTPGPLLPTISHPSAGFRIHKAGAAFPLMWSKAGTSSGKCLLGTEPPAWDPLGSRTRGQIRGSSS